MTPNTDCPHLAPFNDILCRICWVLSAATWYFSYSDYGISNSVLNNRPFGTVEVRLPTMTWSVVSLHYFVITIHTSTLRNFISVSSVSYTLHLRPRESAALFLIPYLFSIGVIFEVGMNEDVSGCFRFRFQLAQFRRPGKPSSRSIRFQSSLTISVP